LKEEPWSRNLHSEQIGLPQLPVEPSSFVIVTAQHIGVLVFLQQEQNACTNGAVTFFFDTVSFLGGRGAPPTALVFAAIGPPFATLVFAAFVFDGDGILKG